jgi:hypothetical protein
MGRPPADKATDKAAAERDIMAALLEVASSLLAQCRLTGPVFRALVVGAWLRLKAKHPSLTKTRFCEALTVPERTFRQWLKTNQPACEPEPKPKDEAPKPPKPPKRPPRRGRFDFSVVVPDTQVAADTTDIKAFGFVLKLVAAQDIGGRDQNLFDSVIIDDHENADLVTKVMLEALRRVRADKVLIDAIQGLEDGPSGAGMPTAAQDEPPGADMNPAAQDELPGADVPTAAQDEPPGADTPTAAQDDPLGRDVKPTGAQGKQAVSDQGTPYVAHKTRDALEQEGVDHAPQREGDPLGKATIERAFGTVKSIAEPILGITNRLAESIEEFRDVGLAKAMTIVLVIALLKAYQAGARAARRAVEARSGLDEQALLRAAQASRERAHAEDQSARMLLTHIHASYSIGGSVTEFIRAFRRFPLPVLHRAERAFAAQAHRDDIRNRKAYFTKLVRGFADEYRAEQAIKQQGDAALDEQRRQAQQHERQLAHWAKEPNQHLQQALEALSAQWNPSSQSLRFGGAGLGAAWLKDALNRLVELHGPTAARDMATGTFDAFARKCADFLGPAGIDAIEALVGEHLPEPRQPQGPSEAIDACASHFGSHNLNNTGPPSRPEPSPPLRT